MYITRYVTLHKVIRRKRIVMRVNTRKLVLTAMMSCVSYVLSTFVYFPRMAPFQHMMNVMCAVILGPVWGFASAFLTGIMRMILGGRTIQALIGAVVGALLSGILYKITKKTYMALVGEVIGTGILSALLVYPFMVWLYELPSVTPFWTFIPAYLPSSLLGGCIGFIIINAMKKAGTLQRIKSMLGD